MHRRPGFVLHVRARLWIRRRSRRLHGFGRARLRRILHGGIVGRAERELRSLAARRRAATSISAEPTKAELYERAQVAAIPGSSIKNGRVPRCVSSTGKVSRQRGQEASAQGREALRLHPSHRALGGHSRTLALARKLACRSGHQQCVNRRRSDEARYRPRQLPIGGDERVSLERRQCHVLGVISRLPRQLVCDLSRLTLEHL